MSEIKSETNSQSLDTLFEEFDKETKIFKEFSSNDDIMSLIRKVKFFDHNQGNSGFKSVETMLMSDIMRVIASKYTDLAEHKLTYTQQLKIKYKLNPTEKLSFLKMVDFDLIFRYMKRMNIVEVTIYEPMITNSILSSINRGMLDEGERTVNNCVDKDRVDNALYHFRKAGVEYRELKRELEEIIRKVCEKDNTVRLTLNVCQYQCYQVDLNIYGFAENNTRAFGRDFTGNVCSIFYHESLFGSY